MNSLFLPLNSSQYCSQNLINFNVNDVRIIKISRSLLKMCRLQKCCCCIDLPTGVKILGILEIIGNLFYIFLCLVGIFAYQTVVDLIANENYAMRRYLLEDNGKGKLKIS